MILRLKTAFPFCVTSLLCLWNNTCRIFSFLENIWDFSNLTVFFYYIYVDLQTRCSLKGVQYWGIPCGISCCTTALLKLKLFFVSLFLLSLIPETVQHIPSPWIMMDLSYCIIERWEHLPDLPTGAFYISKPAERKLSLVIRRRINAQLYKGKDSLNPSEL